MTVSKCITLPIGVAELVGIGIINAYKYFTSCEIDFHYFTCTYIEDTIKIHFRWSLFEWLELVIPFYFFKEFKIFQVYNVYYSACNKCALINNVKLNLIDYTISQYFTLTPNKIKLQ